MSYWKSWGGVTLRLISLVASIASIVGIIYPDLPSLDKLQWWQVLFVFTAAFFFVAVIIMEIRSHRGHRAFRLIDKSRIQGYLLKWISQRGRVAIWSRDLSWATDGEARKLLCKKAEAGELIICLPKSQPITDELEKLGAEICIYNSKSEDPSSRFTVAFFGQDGARVAVGRPSGEFHLIDEFYSDQDPVFHIASDLIQLARGTNNAVSKT